MFLEDKSGENECENGAGGSERTCYRYGAYLQGAIQREESQRSTHSSKDSDETAECKGCQREGKIPEPESDCSEREQPEHQGCEDARRGRHVAPVQRPNRRHMLAARYRRRNRPIASRGSGSVGLSGKPAGLLRSSTAASRLGR